MKLISIAIFCITAAMSSNVLFADSKAKYPTEWFKEVPRKTAKWWEILPQDAKPGEVILSKRNDLGLLSNFASTPVVIDGVKYKSLEGFWQMMKYPEGKEDPRFDQSVTWPHTRAEVAQMTAFEAKKAGDIGSKNMKALKINWVTYQGQQMTYRTPEKGDHYQVIYRAMWEKLRQNREVLDVLMKTGNLRLKPDHKQGDNPPPAWQYHKIYMEMRSKIRRQPELLKKSI